MRVGVFAWMDLNVTEGSVVRVIGTTQYMRSLGWEPVLLTATQPPSLFEEFCEVVVVPYPRFYAHKACILTALIQPLGWAQKSFRYEALASALKRAKLDLVHCHHLYSAISLFPMRSELRMPIIYDQHGILAIQKDDRLRTDSLPYKLLLPIELRAERRLYVTYDGFCANSERVKRLIIKLFGADEKKVFVIPDGTSVGIGYDGDMRRLRANLDRRFQTDDDKVIAFVGTFKPLGGVMDLVQAYHLVYKKRQDVSLILIGSGGLWSEVNRYLINNSLHKVRLPGRLPYDQSIQYLRAADVAVVPEKQHIHNQIKPPIKLLDCLACGTPTVATDLPDAREFIVDGRNGILARPDSPADLAAGIERLLASESLRREIRARAPGMFPTRHLWQNISVDVINMYEAVIAKASGLDPGLECSIDLTR